MSAENAKEMVELLGDITQVGIVIEDMEKAKAGMLKVFGLKPDAESDNLYIWHDYLDEGFRKHGHALHHLRFDVENNDEVTKAMEEREYAKYMEGKSLVDPTATFTYYDSVEALGFIIEAVTKSKE